MRHDAPTTGTTTITHLSSVPVPSISDDDTVFLPIGEAAGYFVSKALREGYLAACKAHTEMQEHDEFGPYVFLTGYEYAHLTRQFIPTDLSGTLKREWHRGFVLGWNARVLFL